jgi:hypothetical protein
MNTLNVGLMQDAAVSARLSRQPLVHVAIAAALRDLGADAYVHRYKVSLQKGTGEWFVIPGLAVEYEGKILSLEAGEGWVAIEEYEKDFNTILFKEMYNAIPTSAAFEHEKISEELFEKMRKKVQVESASMFAVFSELVEKNMLTISQKQAKVLTP